MCVLMAKKGMKKIYVMYKHLEGIPNFCSFANIKSPFSYYKKGLHINFEKDIV